MLALFQMLAETGKVLNRGKRFVVAHGVQKKKDERDWADIQSAARILNENDQAEKKKRG